MFRIVQADDGLLLCEYSDFVDALRRARELGDVEVYRAADGALMAYKGPVIDEDQRAASSTRRRRTHASREDGTPSPAVQCMALQAARGAAEAMVEQLCTAVPRHAELDLVTPCTRAVAPRRRARVTQLWAMRILPGRVRGHLRARLVVQLLPGR